MSYQALYRQYRPATFEAVIGQEHITTILKNQVSSGHIAHAYLFSGTRGTGKTTSARIFARAINCLDPQNGEPCGKCEACLISASDNPDIVELDAASNSSVDDIRALVEKARYTPMQLKTKVYIIDEAHALASSSQAFNALLKTLEEPPAHLVFILATTEPQKLPATIRSRCQHLDFHRLRVNDMVALLREVVEKSGAHIEDDGLVTIARAADGGMRDALSLADQCLAFCGDTISAEDVCRVLGSMDGDFLFRMADALIACDAGASLSLLARVVDDGRDLSVFTHDLTLHLRSLLITKICGDAESLLECSPDDAKRYRAQSEKCGEARLLRAVELLSSIQSELKWLSAPRARIESTLVRIAHPEQAESIIDLKARIEALEDQLKSFASRPAAPAPVQSAAPEPAPEELPPWDMDEPVRPAPPVKPAPVKAKDAPAPATSDGSVQSRWDNALNELKNSDMLLYGMARRAKPEESEHGITLGFSSEIYANAVKKSVSLIEGILGCPVSVRLNDEKAEKTRKAEANAKALFGDALRIKDE